VTLIAEIALVVVAGLGVAVCVRLLPRSRPRPARSARTASDKRPAQLGSLEQLVPSSTSTALHVHAYLRPLLAEIATRRLAARGLALEQMSDPVGRRVLGDQLWEIVAPARPFPEDRYGPGISTHELGAMLDVLERL
jgi:hypothetical protein